MRAVVLLVALCLVNAACGSPGTPLSTYTLRISEHVEVPSSDSDADGTNACVAACQAQAQPAIADCMLRCPAAVRESGPCKPDASGTCVERTVEQDVDRDGPCNSGQDLPTDAKVISCRQTTIGEKHGPSGWAIALGVVVTAGLLLLTVLTSAPRG